jgi:hypothetical protein
MDWKDHNDFGIRHYSGTAVYETTFDVPEDWIGGTDRLAIDLGEVAIIAEVFLNEKPVGVLWKPPFRGDVTRNVKPGENHLRVKVANQWTNRLIGDENLPPDIEWCKDWKGALRDRSKFPEWVSNGTPRPEPRRKTFTTWRHVVKEDPLLPSGLLGPVRLLPAKVVAVQSGARITRRNN